MPLFCMVGGGIGGGGGEGLALATVASNGDLELTDGFLNLVLYL